MKMSLYNTTLSSLENYNFNTDSQALNIETEKPCFNSLELDSNEFGLAKMNGSILRLKIMWTKHFFERLTRLSIKCSRLEMMLKYIVKYKKISGLKCLNQNEKNYESFTRKVFHIIFSLLIKSFIRIKKLNDVKNSRHHLKRRSC